MDDNDDADLHLNLISDREMEMCYEMKQTISPILPQTSDDTLQQFDKMAIDLQWNTNITTKETEDTEKTLELKSPSITIIDQNFLLKDMKIELEKIPNYLTKRNESFQHIIRQIQSMITTGKTNININKLRQISLLNYKIMVIQTYQHLWTTYLKSGLGQLIIAFKEQTTPYSTTISIWPKDLKVLLQVPNNNKNEHEVYLNFVEKQLHELDYQLQQVQTQLNIKANNFNGYTFTINKTIETYIEQHLQSFRMPIEHQIHLIHYDYEIRALKEEYFRHNPTTHQVQLMKQICRSKYEQETIEQELNFLKEQINYYNSPEQSFECSPIAQSTLIDSIQNKDIRQQLFQRYKDVAIQSRTKLFNFYLRIVKNEREEYKKKYENQIKQLWSNHKSSNNNETIPLIMIQLINQRCDKISERIKCIFKFKVQSIRCLLPN